jgi:PAT family beta-lactamase induction signal transducer AmpG
MVLAMQLIIAIAFLIVGLIPLNHFFVISLAIFWIAAFASASNMCSDGFFNLALEKTNNLFLRHRSTFYRLSMLTGLIVIIGGYLEQQYGTNKSMVYT